MLEVSATNCCGVREITGVQTAEEPSEVIENIAEDLLGEFDGAFAFFTCNDDSTMGRRLAEFVAENGLGVVHASNTKHNPNSGHNLTMYVWELDLEALRAFTAPETTAFDRAGTGIRVGTPVRHDTYGVGEVSAIRTGTRTNIGVMFARPNTRFHDLDGNIGENRGMWVSQERVVVV